VAHQPARASAQAKFLKILRVVPATAPAATSSSSSRHARRSNSSVRPSAVRRYDE